MLSQEQIISQAQRVIRDAFVGTLVTVDAAGYPVARLMGAAPIADGLHKIYCLSGAAARKIEQIRAHPQVCWIFASTGCADVVTLFGRARVLTTPIVAQGVWDRLAECTRAYCMSALSDQQNLDFVTIETEVNRVELLSPRQQIYIPVAVQLVDV